MDAFLVTDTLPGTEKGSIGLNVLVDVEAIGFSDDFLEVKPFSDTWEFTDWFTGETITESFKEGTTFDDTDLNGGSGTDTLSGNAGNDGRNTAPMSYEDIYNSTIKSLRQDISKGRIPTTQGAKKVLGGVDINVSTNKLSNENNEKVTERGVASTKVYNSLPQPEKCYQTTNKSNLPNFFIFCFIILAFLNKYLKLFLLNCFTFITS